MVVEENNGNMVVVAAVSSIVMSTSIKTSNNLSFLAWNINGLSSKSLGDKSQHSEFLDPINNFDFVILRETRTRSKVVEVRGFRYVTQNATQSRKGGRDSGGIVLLYKDTFLDWISIVKKTCNFLWFKIEKDYAKTVKDMYTMAFIYLHVIHHILM